MHIFQFFMRSVPLHRSRYYFFSNFRHENCLCATFQLDFSFLLVLPSLHQRTKWLSEYFAWNTVRPVIRYHKLFTSDIHSIQKHCARGAATCEVSLGVRACYSLESRLNSTQLNFIVSIWGRVWLKQVLLYYFVDA